MIRRWSVVVSFPVVVFFAIFVWFSHIFFYSTVTVGAATFAAGVDFFFVKIAKPSGKRAFVMKLVCCNCFIPIWICQRAVTI